MGLIYLTILLCFIPPSPHAVHHHSLMLNTNILSRLDSGLDTRMDHLLCSRITNFVQILVKPQYTYTSLPKLSRSTGHWVPFSGVQRGGLGCSTPSRNSESPPKLCQTQPDLWKLLKIVEFKTPTPQDVRKKGSKILKLPRIAIVLH
jgi:hypothetical protein